MYKYRLTIYQNVVIKNTGRKNYHEISLEVLTERLEKERGNKKSIITAGQEKTTSNNAFL